MRHSFKLAEEPDSLQPVGIFMTKHGFSFQENGIINLLSHLEDDDAAADSLLVAGGP